MQDATIAPDRLISIGSAYRKAKLLLSAIELDVFTILAERPLDADTLIRRLGLHSRAARDFLDALVALALLERSDDGRYSNSAEAALYLNRSGINYLGGIFDQFDKREYEMWSTLIDAVRTGKPQTGISAAEHFASLYNDPERFRTFVNAMTAGSLPGAKAIARQFPWRRYKTIMDIGTAQGCLPVQVASQHPHISGGGFDLPELEVSFQNFVHDHNLSDRLSFRPGNFFNDPLPSADVLVIGRVLHNWDLPTKKMLLDKAYRSLPKGGAVIVYDMLIDDERKTAIDGLLSSLNMLVWTASGFGYSGADCMGWMRQSGFSATRVEPLVAGQSMVIGEK